MQRRETNCESGVKNVRKIHTREKHMELEEWTKTSDCDVCAINETGLNRNEYTLRWVT